MTAVRDPQAPVGAYPTLVDCPLCQFAGRAESIRFGCTTCRGVWWWSSCGRCQAGTWVADVIQSWSCDGCGHGNRSWWKVISAAVLEGLSAADQDEPKRRTAVWVAAASAIAVLLLAGAVFLKPAPPDHRASACAQYERVAEGIATGTLDGREVDSAIAAAVRSAAQTEGLAEQAAAWGQAANSGPGSLEYQEAASALQVSCG